MEFSWRKGVFLSFIFLGTLRVTCAADPFPLRGPTVPGKVARLRHGVACAPETASLAVKRAIWAGNQLRKRPYRWGGGHLSFADSGYACSGTVSYVLAGAVLIRIPMS